MRERTFYSTTSTIWGIKPKGPLGIPPRILFPQPVGTIFRFRPTPTNLNTLRLLYFFVFWEDSPHATVSTGCSARPLALRSNPMPVGAVLSLCGRNSFPGYGRRARGLTLQGSRFFSYDGSSYMSAIQSQLNFDSGQRHVCAEECVSKADHHQLTRGLGLCDVRD